MKNVYTPDRWVVVEITGNGNKYRRVLAGWYGGYAGSDSWKLGSAIEKVEETDTHYLFVGQSGSGYKCYKNAHGFSMYMQDVFYGFMKDLEGTGTIELVEDY